MDFKKVYGINVNEWTEKKGQLTYLSWANAWAKFVEIYPGATYKILKDNGIPYFGNEQIGYMVYTMVTVEDLTHEMWLPVMDNNNKTMKFNSYTYDTKFKKDIKVEAIDMFAVNKAIMRCLTKNLAMFGLGLYIYAGEDIPNEDDVDKVSVPTVKETLDYAKKLGVTEQQLIAKYNSNMGEKEQVTKFDEISNTHRLALYKLLQKQEKAKK